MATGSRLRDGRRQGWPWRLLLIAIMLCGGISVAQGRAGVPLVAAANGLDVGVSAIDPLIGAQITYTITVKNTRSDRAYNLDVLSLLPPGVTYVSSTPTFAPTQAYANGTGPGTPAAQRQVQLTFTNMVDVVPTETFTFTIVGQLDNGILPGTTLNSTVSARASSDPRKPATDGGTGYSSGDVDETSTAQPFTLTKVLTQSTGVNQATGDCASDRHFFYTLTAKNNGLLGSTNLTITDLLPYGVGYCPGLGDTPTGITYNPDGTTRLTYTFANLASNGTKAVQVFAAIPYAYPTTQGGVTITSADAGTPIADGTTYRDAATNCVAPRCVPLATLVGTYPAGGASYTASADPTSVTAKYATIKKSGAIQNPSSSGNADQGSRVDYTITGYTSLFYDASYQGAGVRVVDVLPNGQDFCLPAANAYADAVVDSACLAPKLTSTSFPTGQSFAPDSVVRDGTSGKTTIVWTLPNTVDTLHDRQFTIVFSAQVRTRYVGGGTPVVSNDAFANTVTLNATAADLVTTARTALPTGDTATAGQPTDPPTLTKTVTKVTRADGVTVPPSGDGAVITSTTARAAVGDIVTFQMTVTAAPGVDSRQVVLTDVLPLNYTYVDGSSSYSGSYIDDNGQVSAATSATGGDFLVYTLTGHGGTGNILPKTESLTVTLRAQVTGYTPEQLLNNPPSTVENLAKLSGENTDGIGYSLRSRVTLTNLSPILQITKTNTPASGLQGNDILKYTITVANPPAAGSTTAYAITNLIDTLPADIRYCDAGVNAGCAAPTSSDANVTFASATTGYGGTVTYQIGRDLAVGQSFMVTFWGQVQPQPAVGTDEVNVATISSARSQPVGATVAETTGPGAYQGTSTARISGDILEKTGKPVKLNGAVPPVYVDGQINADGRVTIGDTIFYTINYRLPPNTQFYNGTLYECLPLGFHYVANSYTGAVVAGTFPNSMADPLPIDGSLTGDPATVTSGAGSGSCPGTQEMLTIPIGTRDNTAPGNAEARFQITLKALITGKAQSGASQAGGDVFTGAAAVYNTRADGTTPNTNSVYFSRAATNPGTAQQVGQIDAPNNGTDNNVYVPRLTLGLTIAQPTATNGTPTATTANQRYGGTTLITPQGKFVNYLLAVSNGDGSTAYDVSRMIATLDPYLTYVGLYASDASCQTATPLPVADVTQNGQSFAIAVNPTATPANSLAPNTTYSVCLRAQVAAGAPASTDLTTGLRLGGDVASAQYYSAPSGFAARRGLLPPTARAVLVRTPDVITFETLRNKTYGDPNFQVGATSTGTGTNPPPPGLTYTATGPCAIASQGGGTAMVRITGASGAQCAITASQLGANGAADVAQSFTIAKAVLTVTVQDQTRQFGDATPPPCVAAGPPTGFKYNDTANGSVSGTLTCTTNATPNSNPGTYQLNPGGYSADNYTFNYVRAKLTITPVTVQVTLTPPTNAMSVTKGTPVTLIASITPTSAGGITPRGYIQFWFAGRLLASTQVDGNGKAQYTFTPTQAPGTYQTEVRYLSSDTRFAPGPSAYGTITLR